MAVHPLSRHFVRFFDQLNPSATFEKRASCEYGTIKGILEDPTSLRELSPTCFLQGSYKQDTTIYTINDVDIVVLCKLEQPGSGTGHSWSRDQIFDALATPLLSDRRYKDKVSYHSDSMCIKVDLGIKIEVLPAVYKAGNNDPSVEPFRIYRPETGSWDDGYAREHQELLTRKNQTTRTGGNFKPTIKILKHLRSRASLGAVSFHIECLLYYILDATFQGGPADYITAVLEYIAKYSADAWYKAEVRTPCRERLIFTPSEWGLKDWRAFHGAVTEWARLARSANAAPTESAAIQSWQRLLGSDFFPAEVSR